MSNPFEPLLPEEEWSPESKIAEEDWRMAIDAFQATDDDHNTEPEEIRKARATFCQRLPECLTQLTAAVLHNQNAQVRAQFETSIILRGVLDWHEQNQHQQRIC